MDGQQPADSDTRDVGDRSPAQVPLERVVAALPESVRRVVAVLRFEIKRTQTYPRIFVWALLAAFPVLIMALLRYENEEIDEIVWGMVLYTMIPQMVCLLGLLLWVAPVVNAEIEGRTWVYVAVRPGGKLALLIGKYLNGVLWTCSAAWTGLTLGMLVGSPQVAEPLRLWAVLALLALLACFSYGAAYALIGALFHRRAMVISVGYVLVFEFVMSNVPAVVNQLTVQYRLFNLLFDLIDLDGSEEMPLLLSEQPPLQHVLSLFVYVFVLLLAAAFCLRFREYSTAEES